MAVFNVVRSIFGVLGNLTSLSLLVSPMPDYMKIYKNKRIDGYSPLPCILTFINCIMWGLYASPLVKLNVLVLTINCIGVLIEGLYAIILFYYSARDQKAKVTCIVSVLVLVVGGSITGGWYMIHGHKGRENFLGILAVSTGILMYCAPTIDTYKAWFTGDTSRVPISLSVAGMLNTLVWLTYGIMKKSKYMMIQNGVGLALSSIQVLVFCWITYF